MPLDLKSVAVLLCLVSSYFCEQPDFTGVNQMAQDCFTEQQGMCFALKSAAVLLCLMTAHLF